MTKKQIVFKVPSGLHPYVLGEELRKASQSQFVSLDIYPTKIVVKLYGDAVSVERSISFMKAAYRKIMEKHKMTSGNEVQIPKDKIASVLGFPLSVDLLTDTLRLLGIPFNESDNEVKVKINYQTLTEYAKKLFDNYILARERFSGAARRVATVISVIFDLDLDTVAKIGERRGVFKKIDEKYTLNVNPQSAYDALMKMDLSVIDEI
ncbi:MAG: DUF2067 domain-containing protein [Fervidicoccaceae archaeon]|nr:DUF2067 domain-containing protein [Fervidicoccaceae archaeon]